jgi:uncharacterized protein
VSPAESLTTFAPVVTDAERLHPTGNLLVSVPELDEHGSCRSLNVVSEAERGVVAAVGELLSPVVEIDGSVVLDAASDLSWTWRREADWLPHAETPVPGGAVSAQWIAPVTRGGRSESGVAARLVHRNETAHPQRVRLAWTGEWRSTVVHHFRAKELELALRTRDDAWTGCRAVYAGADRLLLSISWRPGEGASFPADQPATGWRCEREAVLDAGATLELDVYVGVSTEPDGSGAAALSLRRTGFDALRAETVSWLEHRGPRFADEPLERVVRRNAFFSHFFAQADCIDTGRVVMLTSRSPRYYVSGAFWSRDAYWWSFPALILVDPVRARRALVSSLAAAGDDIAHHALYVTGQRLYPGFELDELVAPVLAVWRYVDATGDRSILDDPSWRRLRATVRRELDEVEVVVGGSTVHTTVLLPTDDPTDFPVTATGNALVALALEAIARLDGDAEAAAAASALREALPGLFVRDGRWAWAVDLDGEPEWRDEPPLGLRLLPYLGIDLEPGTAAGDAHAATLRWLVTAYPFHYDGPYPGAGAPHFASPSSFDLGNRLLTGDASLGDPRAQLAGTPMDNGIACESWDPRSGIVVTGQAMASVAGFLAWAAWADAVGHRRWDDPFPLPAGDRGAATRDGDGTC